MDQAIKQIVVTPQTDIDDEQAVELAAFFDDAGNPVDVGGGGGTDSVSWDEVTGKPSTFPPADHTHPMNDVTGLTDELAAKQDAGDYAKSSELSSGLAGKADAGHTHAFASLAGSVAGATGADLQAIIEDIASRLTSLEGA